LTMVLFYAWLRERVTFHFYFLLSKLKSWRLSSMFMHQQQQARSCWFSVSLSSSWLISDHSSDNMMEKYSYSLIRGQKKLRNPIWHEALGPQPLPFNSLVETIPFNARSPLSEERHALMAEWFTMSLYEVDCQHVACGKSNPSIPW
jgi:hypothetical protein